MPIAFVLINSKQGLDESIIDELKSNLSSESGITYDIQGVYGIYDIILKIASDDGTRLHSVITNKVRRIGKAQSTLTMMVIEEQEVS